MCAPLIPSDAGMMQIVMVDSFVATLDVLIDTLHLECSTNTTIVSSSL